MQHWKRLKDFLLDESVVAGDGEREAHKLPVCLLLLLVGVVRDLEAGRVVRTCRHPAHTHTHHQNSVRTSYNVHGISTLLEKCCRISLFVADDAIAKLYVT